MAAESGTVARRAILTAGLIAASLDLAYACGAWWLAKEVPPVRIFQSIASGWLGKSAFDGGAAIALLGVVSHYAILLVASALYWLASGRFAVLVRQASICGLAYGAAIYLFMNRVVLPLSAMPPRSAPPETILVIGDVASHLFLVGLVIASTVRHFRRAR